MARQNSLGHDFRRLWGAYTVSAVGSAVGMGALPLVALLVLHSSTFQVSVLAALSAVASALIVLPLGVRIEHRYKRPVMVTADLVRCAVLTSVPVAAAFGALTFAQLCTVGILQTAASVGFNAASGAHLKALVLPEVVSSGPCDPAACEAASECCRVAHVAGRRPHQGRPVTAEQCGTSARQPRDASGVGAPTPGRHP